MKSLIMPAFLIIKRRPDARGYSLKTEKSFLAAHLISKTVERLLKNKKTSS